MEASLFCGSFFSFWYLSLRFGVLALDFLQDFAKQTPIIYFLAYQLYIQPSLFLFLFFTFFTKTKTQL
jgi:hypothetical protein